MNVNSIKSREKFLQFKDLLLDLNINFDIIALMETNLDEETDTFYNLRDFYKAYHNVRSRSGGSSVIFVKNSRISSQEYISKNEEIEFLIIKLIKENINICLVYLPPVNSAAKFDSFFEKLEFVLRVYKNTIMVGDTNMNLLCSVSPNQLNYTNLLASHSFSILNYINSRMVTRVDATDLENCDMLFYWMMTH